MTDVSSPAGTGAGSAGSTAAAGDLTQKLDDKPELALGGAFVGGLLAALILKRLAR